MIVKKKKFYQTHLLHGSADNYALLFLSLFPSLVWKPVAIAYYKCVRLSVCPRDIGPYIRLLLLPRSRTKVFSV